MATSGLWNINRPQLLGSERLYSILPRWPWCNYYIWYVSPRIKEVAWFPWTHGKSCGVLFSNCYRV